jgi:hypothetical protein
MHTDREKMFGILMAIENGQMDQYLTEINKALKSRSDLLRNAQVDIVRGTLIPGSKVTLQGLTPKYVNGKVATVVRVNQSRVVVTPDQPDRRFRGEVTVPLSCVTLLKEEALA